VCALLAGDWQVTGGVLKIAHRIWQADVAGWPVAVDGGVLSITVAAWTAGFQWWHSGDITRMHNVSEYMLILTVCLVISVYVVCVSVCIFSVNLCASKGGQA